MKAIGALILALGREFVRDRTALFFTLAFPFIFMIIFGLLMQGLDRPRNFDIGLVVEDASPAASQLANALRNVPVLKITQDGFDAEQDRLEEGDRDAVIVVSEGFGDTVAAGRDGDGARVLRSVAADDGDDSAAYLVADSGRN